VTVGFPPPEQQLACRLGIALDGVERLAHPEIDVAVVDVRRPPTFTDEGLGAAIHDACWPC
jgi:hypothetical protein